MRTYYTSLMTCAVYCFFNQLPAFEPQPAPGSGRPEPLPHGGFGFQQGLVARAWPQRESGRGAVLNDAPVLDDEDAVERLRLAHIMGNAE